VESPSLEIFQPRLDAVLCSLLWVTLLGQGVGLGDPQRSLPTPAMLGFCDSVRGPHTEVGGFWVTAGPGSMPGTGSLHAVHWVLHTTTFPDLSSSIWGGEAVLHAQGC